MNPLLNFSFISSFFCFFLALRAASSSSKDFIPGKMAEETSDELEAVTEDDVDVLLLLSLEVQK